MAREALSSIAPKHYRQLQRGSRSSEALTQRATFGAEQVASQLRPREFTLHDVVPVEPPRVLVLLVVLVTTLLSLPPLVLLLLVLMLVLLLLTLLMLMLLEVVPAPTLLTAKHNRRATP